jgi:hypothetical protein
LVHERSLSFLAEVNHGLKLKSKKTRTAFGDLNRSKASQMQLCCLAAPTASGRLSTAHRMKQQLQSLNLLPVTFLLSNTSTCYLVKELVSPKHPPVKWATISQRKGFMKVVP